MIGAQTHMHVVSGTRANAVVTLSTDGGTHKAAAWARAATETLVSIDPASTPDRRKQIESFRARVCAIFYGGFEAMKPRSSQDEIEDAARAVSQRILDLFAASPWAMQTDHPVTRQMVIDHVRRNLRDAADLALQTE